MHCGSDLASDSKCIFGISKRPASLPKGALQINAFFYGRNYMMLTAPGNRLYWFLFADMERATGADIPRFTKDDEFKLAGQHLQDQVSRSTTFGEVYESRLHTALVAIEEHVFPQWHFERIITIGDAAHKVRQSAHRLAGRDSNARQTAQVHPNTAQGGNGALETSAVLFNALSAKLDESTSPSDKDIEDVFAHVQSSRLARADNALEQGRRTSSISTRDTIAARAFVHFVFPWFGERIIMWLAVEHAETGPVIEKLPLPVRHGVTLPHSGTVKARGNGNAMWRFGVLGTVVVAMSVYVARSSGWAGSSTAVVNNLLGLVRRGSEL